VGAIAKNTGISEIPCIELRTLRGTCCEKAPLPQRSPKGHICQKQAIFAKIFLAGDLLSSQQNLLHPHPRTDLASKIEAYRFLVQ
jgi:hypothetical protein